MDDHPRRGRAMLGYNAVSCSVTEAMSGKKWAAVRHPLTSALLSRILRFHSSTADTVVYAICPSALSLVCGKAKSFTIEEDTEHARASGA